MKLLFATALFFALMGTGSSSEDQADAGVLLDRPGFDDDYYADDYGQYNSNHIKANNAKLFGRYDDDDHHAYDIKGMKKKDFSKVR